MQALMRYTIKADELQTHLELLHAVYEELSTSQPEHFHWATYQLDDPRAFVEIVIGADLPGPLPSIESFQRYRVGLDARCDGPREFIELHEAGAYALPCVAPRLADPRTAP